RRSLRTLATAGSAVLPVVLFSVMHSRELYTLSLHDALPISNPISTSVNGVRDKIPTPARPLAPGVRASAMARCQPASSAGFKARDRKSTRLNSSHVSISYAVFCLKKKKSSTPRVATDDDIHA